MQYLILAALVIAGLIVGVDAIRERAARRKALDVPGLVAAAARASGSGGAMVAPALSAALATAPAVTQEPGLWDELAATLDPETFVPTLAEGSEIKSFAMRWGNDFAIVARPDHALHFELQPWEAALMAQMDGTKTTQELIVDHLQAAGDLDPGAVLGLIVALREGGFLDPARPDVQALVQVHLDRASAGRRKLRDFAKNLRISWAGAERFVEGAYHGGLKLFFRPAMVVLGALVAIVGLAAFIDVQQSGRYQLSVEAAPGETLIFLVAGPVPDLRTRARARDGADPLRATGARSRLLHLLRVAGVLRRCLRRTDDGSSRAHRAVVRRTLLRDDPGRSGLPRDRGHARQRRRGVPVPLRADQLLHHLHESDPVARARRVLDLLGPDPDAGPATALDQLHPGRPVAQDREVGEVQPAGGRSGLLRDRRHRVHDLLLLHRLLLLAGDLRRADIEPVERRSGLAHPAGAAGPGVHRAVDPRAAHARPNHLQAPAVDPRPAAVPRAAFVARRGRRADRCAARLRRPRRGRAVGSGGTHRVGDRARRPGGVPARRRRRRLLRRALGNDPHRGRGPGRGRHPDHHDARAWRRVRRVRAHGLRRASGDRPRGGRSDVVPRRQGRRSTDCSPTTSTRRTSRRRCRPTRSCAALPPFRTLSTADLALVLEHGEWRNVSPGRDD